MANKKRKLQARQCIGQIEEKDGVFLSGLDESVGSYIKNQALKKYAMFNDISLQEQTAVSLGMNSILDLSFEFGDAQSLLFSEGQWSELKARFPDGEEQDLELEENLNNLINDFKLTIESVAKSKTSFETKMNTLSNWLRRTNKVLNDEETFLVFLVQHVLKLYKKSSYLFQKEIDCSEWDFVLKIWSPIVEELFNDTNLRSKWGDTVYKLGNEDGTADLKIDLRILFDKTIQRFNVEHDISSGEFSKYDPGHLKYQSDRCKLMIEGKTIINNLVSRGLDLHTIPILQICGTELIIIVNSLVAPGLYVGNELNSFSLVNTFENFKILPDMVKSLLNFKKNCLEIGSIVDDHVKTTERTKGSTKGVKYQPKNQQLLNSKKQWTRSNWIVFREQKYTSTSIPPPPF